MSSARPIMRVTLGTGADSSSRRSTEDDFPIVKTVTERLSCFFASLAIRDHSKMLSDLPILGLSDFGAPAKRCPTQTSADGHVWFEGGMEAFG